MKRFVYRFLLVFLSWLALCNAQTVPSLKSFFIAAHVVSDAAPFWSEDILDVQPADRGSQVRNIRLAPPAAFCPSNVAIRALEMKVNVAPDRIVESANPCSISQSDFRQALSKVAFSRSTLDDPPSYTIVATCESEQRIIRVPSLQGMDMKALRKQSPGAAGIAELYSNLEKRFFHSELHAAKKSRDQELQSNAQKLIPDLKSGKFDAGFDDGRLKEILAIYRGPMTGVLPMPKLIDFQKWKFQSYADPVYPSMVPFGKPALADTKVDLEFYIDSTGNVRSFRIVHGSEVFRTATTDAVVQWVFEAGQKFPTPLKLTLDYSLGCQISPPKQ